MSKNRTSPPKERVSDPRATIIAAVVLVAVGVLAFAIIRANASSGSVSEVPKQMTVGARAGRR